MALSERVRVLRCSHSLVSRVDSVSRAKTMITKTSAHFEGEVVSRRAFGISSHLEMDWSVWVLAPSIAKDLHLVAVGRDSLPVVMSKDKRI